MLRYNNSTAPVALFMNGWADSPKRGKQNKQMIYYTTNTTNVGMESHRLYNDEGATIGWTASDTSIGITLL